MKNNYIIKLYNLNNKFFFKYKKFNINYIKIECYSILGKLNIFLLNKIKIKLYTKNKLLYLFCEKNKYNNLLKLYFNLINNIIFSINGGYFLKLNLKGRGYFLKILKNNLFLEFKLGFSHLIKYYLSNNFLIKKLDKNIFLLYSLSFDELKIFAKIIQNYKYPDIYKSKGFLFDKEIIQLKEGKKKN